jgi:HK97 family phage major capsid protein
MENSIKDLLDKKGQLAKELEALSNVPANEKRSINAEEKTKFDSLYNELTAINDTVSVLQRKEELAKSLLEKPNGEARSQKEIDSKELRTKAFRKYMVEGEKGLNSEERAALGEMRAQSTTSTAGGFLIPEGFSYEVDKALKAYGGLMSVARILPTATGNDIPWPKYNDTANVGAILAENTQATEQDIVFGSTTLKSFNYTSKVIRTSMQLFQDAGIPVESIIADAFVERIGRAFNGHATATGNGSTQPEAVVTAASSTGVNQAAASAISKGDLMNLKYGLDAAYRENAVWMLNDTTVKAILNLSIGTDYETGLWQPGLSLGQPDTILGHRYIVNNQMPEIGAGNASVLFGDFSKYIIRDVQGITLRRMDELYAEYDQVGWVMFKRYDGRYIGSTGAQAAIKKLVHTT